MMLIIIIASNHDQRASPGIRASEAWRRRGTCNPTVRCVHIIVIYNRNVKIDIDKRDRNDHRKSVSEFRISVRLQCWLIRIMSCHHPQHHHHQHHQQHRRSVDTKLLLVHFIFFHFPSFCVAPVVQRRKPSTTKHACGATKKTFRLGCLRRVAVEVGASRFNSYVSGL